MVYEKEWSVSGSQKSLVCKDTPLQNKKNILRFLLWEKKVHPINSRFLTYLTLKLL